MDPALEFEELSKQFGALPARFVFIEVLGRGASGIVLRVNDRQLDRELALKILNQVEAPDSVQAERFHREAKLLVQMDHPNLLKIYFSGLTDHNHPFHAMELLKGQTLAELTQTNQSLKSQEFFEVFTQLADGLSYMHAKNIVHRDIKPSNIIITRNENEKCVCKLIDFGLARFDNSESGAKTFTVLGSLVGTPAFMSPEQCKGEKAQAKSDIYSLACVMYQCLTGKAPFAAESPLEIMQKHLHEEAPSLEGSGANRKLSTLIANCLSKSKEQRPEAQELLIELKKLAQEFSGTIGGFRLARSKQRRYHAVFALVLLAIIVASIAGGIYMANNARGAKKVLLESSLHKEDSEKAKLDYLESLVERKQAILNKEINPEQRTQTASFLCRKIVDFEEKLRSSSDNTAEKTRRLKLAIEYWQYLIEDCRFLEPGAAERYKTTGLMRLSQIYRDNGRPGEALVACNNAIALSEKNDFINEKIELLAIKIPILLRLHDLDACEATLSNALKYWRKYAYSPLVLRGAVRKKLTGLESVPGETFLNNRVMEAITNLYSEGYSDQEKLRILAMANALALFSIKSESIYSHLAANKALEIMKTIPPQTKGFAKLARESYSLAEQAALDRNYKANAAQYRKQREEIK